MMISQYFTRWILPVFYFTRQRQNGIGNANAEETSMARLLSAVVCASVLVSVGAAGAESFALDCTLPLESIAKHRPIDDTCAAHGDAPLRGGSANDSAQALQNLAKNNFCATGTPALVTFISFKRLQQKLDQESIGGESLEPIPPAGGPQCFARHLHDERKRHCWRRVHCEVRRMAD